MKIPVRITGIFKVCQAFSEEKELYSERDTLIKRMNTFSYLKTGNS